MAVLADELLADFADAEPSGAPRVLLAGCWALAALSRSDQGRDFVCAPPLSIAAASQLVTRGMGLEAPPAPDPDDNAAESPPSPGGGGDDGANVVATRVWACAAARQLAASARARAPLCQAGRGGGSDLTVARLLRHPILV